MAPMKNCPRWMQGRSNYILGYMVILEIRRPNKLGYVTFIQNESTFARPKKCKHWFSYCSKIVLNDYTKEICAKQVANQSDFLMAFLHLEPLLIQTFPLSKMIAEINPALKIGTV